MTLSKFANISTPFLEPYFSSQYAWYKRLKSGRRGARERSALFTMYSCSDVHERRKSFNRAVQANPESQFGMFTSIPMLRFWIHKLGNPRKSFQFSLRLFFKGGLVLENHLSAYLGVEQDSCHLGVFTSNALFNAAIIFENLVVNRKKVFLIISTVEATEFPCSNIFEFAIFITTELFAKNQMVTFSNIRLKLRSVRKCQNMPV